MTGASTVPVDFAFTSTNQNGTLNMILHLAQVPCWLDKELRVWWIDGLACPEYHAHIILGHNKAVTNTGKTFEEPIIYQGPVRFDTSPRTPGQDCPRPVYMIIPYTFEIYVQGVQEITILSIRRHNMPPCS